jgi:creatinine amidohydrolase
MMLHLHPTLVRLDLIPQDPPADFPPYDMYPTRTEWVPAGGALSSARGSSAEKGARITSEVVSRIVAAVQLEFGL